MTWARESQSWRNKREYARKDHRKISTTMEDAARKKNDRKEVQKRQRLSGVHRGKVKDNEEGPDIARGSSGTNEESSWNTPAIHSRDGTAQVPNNVKNARSQHQLASSPMQEAEINKNKWGSE